APRLSGPASARSRLDAAHGLRRAGDRSRGDGAAPRRRQRARRVSSLVGTYGGARARSRRLDLPLRCDDERAPRRDPIGGERLLRARRTEPERRRDGGARRADRAPGPGNAPRRSTAARGVGVTGEKVCPQCGVVYPASASFCETDGSALRLPEQGSDLVGSVVADRYHVIAKLGEGGMGQVYLAEHVKMGRKSALKVMRPSLVKDVDAITRFNREAANASRISHPNVAAVYDFGETPDGLIYLAMELVDGRPLSALLAEKHCLTPARAAEIVRQTADALAAAHDLGIVHRDLKPDNIMLARGRDGADLVKVVDFGIAKVADSDAQKVTKTGSIIGTPEYMSPEQLAGDPLDARSDVYALGLVAFAMLTGTLPFPSNSAQEALIMRLTERPRTLAMAQPGAPWPAAVQTALDGALERDAARRYQSAVDFARALVHATAEMSGDVDQLGVTRPMTAVQFAPTAQPLPTTRLSGGVARGAAVSSSRQTSRVSMLGGIAAVVVL